jgi:hypothetical protein
MRTLTAICLLLLTICPPIAHAQGECAIDESFDTGIDEAWRVTDPVAVQSVDDVLRVQFTGPDYQVEYATATDCIYADFSLEADVRDRDGTGSAWIGIRTQGSDSTGYSINLRSSAQDVVLAKGPIGFRSTWIASAHIEHQTDRWRRVRIDAAGPRIQVYVDDVLYIDAVDTDPLLSGWIDLGVNAGGDWIAFAEFDNIRVEPMAAVSHSARSLGSVKAIYR